MVNKIVTLTEKVWRSHIVLVTNHVQH